ncbi:MAG: carboxypeptidase-like regulatory domain-containing protein [Bacteroidales bacterium]|nr:carboxypeptidase-like regulatory domain-containing protein [Bacteroidales bacterium]
MKSVVITVLVFLSVFVSAQNQKLTAIVKDSKTGEALPYCNVLVVGTNKGTITNADGFFSISVNLESDMLEFSYLGYEKLNVQASSIVKTKVVKLIKNSYELAEVEIHADNDYLYDIFVKCRKNLQLNNSEHISKAYYAIETKATPIEVYYPDTNNYSRQNPFPELNSSRTNEQQEKTVELLECFYNASIVGDRVIGLKFRNGKLFSLPAENYFISSESSKAMGYFCCFEKNEVFPSCPFQYGKNAMRKIFNLELLAFDGNNYNIKFYPLNNSKKYFSGDVWIEKESMRVLKINLMIDSAEIIPFDPIIRFDTIQNFRMNISNSFSPQNRYLPDYTVFDYSFDYVSRRDTMSLLSGYKNTLSKMTSNGLIYYYDYENPFVLPYFEYNLDYADYILMCLLPYNKEFWETNNVVELTDNQKDKFLIGGGVNINDNQCSVKDGKMYLENYSTGNNDLGIFLMTFYVFWNAEKRLLIDKLIVSDNLPDLYPDQMCNLVVQIVLDITEVEDSFICKSWSVFDVTQSVYLYDDTPDVESYFNIYFDICEIERRKMQKKLEEKNYTLVEIDAIYNSTKAEIAKISKQFYLETERGHDEKGIRKWNKYVVENLGIDNLGIARKNRTD